MAAFCHHCGVKLPGDSRFCPECGAAIPAVDPMPGVQGAAPVSTLEPLPETAQTKTPKFKTGKRWVVGGLVGAVVLLALLILSVGQSDDQPSSKDVAAITALDAADKAAADKAAEAKKATLDYTKPVYTTNHAIVCPMSLLSDPRANHDYHAVLDMYMSTFTADSQAAKLGCEVLTSGIRVVATPGPDVLVTVNKVYFTVAAHLTNNADGSMQPETDSIPARPNPSTPVSITPPGAVQSQLPASSIEDIEKAAKDVDIPTSLRGRWTILRSIRGLGGVTCMADEGESTVVGRSIEYSANSITWNGSKAQRATAKMLDVTNKQYRDSYRVDLNSLGMKSEKATIIEIAHPDANVIDCSTQIPGDTVMFKDRNTIIIWVDNNYFEAVRQPNT